MKSILFIVALLSAVLFSGCAGYKWGASVPQEYRKISVPVFENMTTVSEIGPIVSQYTLREFQREGSFKIVRPENAVIEVQGVLQSMTRKGIAYDRGQGMRASEYRYEIVADVTFVDKKNGKVLLERKGIKGETSFLTNDDLLTGQRNASFRIADDIARQIVNEALALPFPNEGKGTGAVEGVQK